jgi:hypothetical protein
MQAAARSGGIRDFKGTSLSGSCGVVAGFGLLSTKPVFPIKFMQISYARAPQPLLEKEFP